MTDVLKESLGIQREAAQLGFDWPDIAPVFDKVREELAEIEEALATGNTAHAQKELGDLLFATLNLSRFLDADPAAELARTNDRFERRFARVKKEFERQQRPMTSCSLEELDAVWEEAKRAENAQAK